MGTLRGPVGREWAVFRGSVVRRFGGSAVRRRALVRSSFVDIRSRREPSRSATCSAYAYTLSFLVGKGARSRMLAHACSKGRVRTRLTTCALTVTATLGSRLWLAAGAPFSELCAASRRVRSANPKNQERALFARSRCFRGRVWGVRVRPSLGSRRARRLGCRRRDGDRRARVGSGERGTVRLLSGSLS